MLETKDLILDKGKLSDWKAMYENVWSRPEAARYMFWNLTTSEADAIARMERTIVHQKESHGFLVYEKASGQAIGFAGIEQVEGPVWQETGICLGPDFVGRGYGKQVLGCLIRYAKEVCGAKELRYTCREENQVSQALARSLNFVSTGAEDVADWRDGTPRRLLTYRLEL